MTKKTYQVRNVSDYDPRLFHSIRDCVIRESTVEDIGLSTSPTIKRLRKRLYSGIYVKMLEFSFLVRRISQDL
jgi:hypothetical protein